MILKRHEFGYIDMLKGDRVVGLTSGVYDLFHFWHLHYLEQCRAQCDFLIVGIDADELVRKFKNKTPVVAEYNRAAVLNSLRIVDAVFIMHSLEDFGHMALYADKIFKNHNKLYGAEIIGKEKLVVIPDVVEVQSTTGLLEKIRKAPPREHEA